MYFWKKAFYVYAATVCMVYPLAFFVTFFLCPPKWFHLTVLYGVVGAFALVFALWFSNLNRGRKSLWTVLIVCFHIFSLPIYWFVVMRNEKVAFFKKQTFLMGEANCAHNNYLEESIACGLLAFALGPFALLPGIVLAHIAHLSTRLPRSREQNVKLVTAYILNYSLTVLWTYFLFVSIREFLRPF